MTKVVVMGVSGCGKTSVGEALARALSAGFVEGDRLHPKANVDKMSSGTPLSDDDRWPWLEAVGSSIAAAEPAVASCSALRRAYRDRLRNVAGPDLRFIFLSVGRDELARRMAGRKHHFMPAGLLESQLATLEDPSGERDVLVLDGSRPVDSIVREAAAWLARPAEETP